jgi:hypothetical protein
MYIDFLTSIHQQLTALKENKAAVTHVTEQRADEQEIAGDGETNLTPSQADFLAFLECLIILAREAARLFEDVTQGKLPIWTASTGKLPDAYFPPVGYFKEDLLYPMTTYVS